MIYSAFGVRGQTDDCGNRWDLGAWMAKHASRDARMGRPYRMNGGLFCIM